MTTSTPLTAPATSAGSDPTPAGPWDAPTKGSIEQVALALFIAVPFLALVAAVPVAWGGLLGWHDVVIALVAYAITGHGFHRYFTHGSFQAPPRPADRARRRRLRGRPGPGHPMGR